MSVTDFKNWSCNLPHVPRAAVTREAGGPDQCGSDGWVSPRKAQAVQFLVRACAWVGGSVPGQGVHEKQLINASPPLFLPFSF